MALIVIGGGGTGGAGGAGVSDGDKGGIVVSLNGSRWVIADKAVGNAQLADMTRGLIKGRFSNGSGPPEDLSAGQIKSLLSLEQVANIAPANLPIQDLVAEQLAVRPVRVPKTSGRLVGSTPVVLNLEQGSLPRMWVVVPATGCTVRVEEFDGTTWTSGGDYTSPGWGWVLPAVDGEDDPVAMRFTRVAGAENTSSYYLQKGIA